MKPIVFFVTILFFAFPKMISAQSEQSIADSLYYVGKDWYSEGDYKQAKTYFNEALRIRKKIFGEKHKDVAKTYYRIGTTERKLKYFRPAIENLKKALEISIVLFGPEHEQVARYHRELGVAYVQIFDLKNFKFHNEKCIHIFEKKYGKESSEVGNTIMHYALGELRIGRYRNAEKQFLQAYQIFNKSSDPKSKDFYRFYNNAGMLYRKQGDYDKALAYAEKALSIKLMHYKETHPSVPKYYSNIGLAYEAKGDLKKALEYFEKTVELEEVSLGSDHPETAAHYSDIANLYAKEGRFQEALSLHQKSLDIREARLGLSHPYVIAGFDQIGITYHEMKAYNKALAFYKKALFKYQQQSSNGSHSIARIYRRMASIYSEQNELDTALYIIGLGMENLSNNFQYKIGNEGENPALLSVQAKVHFLKMLTTKSEILEIRYDQNKNKLDLQNALKAIESSIDVIEKMRHSYQSESSREDLNERVASIFSKAVNLAFRMYELTNDEAYLFKSLNFSEKSKASILWQHMNENFALENAGIPTKELQELELLNAQLRDLSEQTFSAKDSTKEILQDQLFDLKEFYETKIKNLEKFNPKYFNLKYATPKLDIEHLQNKVLDSNTALIEYFHDKNHLYTFVISQNKSKGFRQAYSGQIEESIEKLRSFNIKKYTQNKDLADDNYIKELNYLHQILWKNIAKEVEEKNQLIIVPHGILNYLSFETLAPSSVEKDFRKLPYLLRKHTIQYAWTLSFLENNNYPNQKYQFPFSGFAPSFSSDSIQEERNFFPSNTPYHLSDLYFSIPEIEAANSHFNGNVFTQTKASESAFHQFAPLSRIIHLATHAWADDQSPMQSGLVFSNQNDTLEDGFLNAYEIYNMSLQADLAVMSACNTGFGQLQEGEGVISIGRAFSYAGCKSIVMSLWMANDQSTSSLVNIFYTNLVKNQRKDLALRNAKISYLENADPLTAHPYFWASLIAIGDMKAINKNTPNYLLIGGLSFLSILIGWILFYKNTNNR